VTRHFNTDNKSVAKLGETEKKEYLEVKLSKSHSRCVCFRNYPSRTNYMIAASFQYSLGEAEHGKPLSDGENIKAAILSASNAFFMIYQTRKKFFTKSLICT